MSFQAVFGGLAISLCRGSWFAMAPDSTTGKAFPLESLHEAWMRDHLYALATPNNPIGFADCFAMASSDLFAAGNAARSA